MNSTTKSSKKSPLPDFFKPLMWSYDFSKTDANKNKKTIIINYGNIRHWQWISKYYGKKTIQNILSNINPSEIRPRALKLATILFSLNDLNYASRSAKT